jgi:hypothetical protein
MTVMSLILCFKINYIFLGKILIYFNYIFMTAIKGLFLAKISVCPQHVQLLQLVVNNINNNNTESKAILNLYE